MALSVENDRLVTLSVRMADMSGKILEETGPEGLTYLHGHGDILSKLEKALEGRLRAKGSSLSWNPKTLLVSTIAKRFALCPQVSWAKKN